MQHRITVGPWRYSPGFGLIEHVRGFVLDLAELKAPDEVLAALVGAVGVAGRFDDWEAGQLLRLVVEVFGLGKKG